MLKQQLDADLKTALLAGEQTRVMTLRSMKSAILYAEVAAGSREQGLADEAIIALLAKESKKRQESADLYRQGGAEDRAKAELAEKEIIDSYLPQQLTDEELEKVVAKAVTEANASGPQAMGQVIGAVKQEVGAQADGGRIAMFVKKRLAL